MTEGSQLVIGIDLGTADSFVAYVSRGAVDVVQNEVSQRKTPSLVGFTDRERLLGDAALSQIKSNAKNSCRNFKHLLGQKFNSHAVKVEEFWSTCPLVEVEDGFTGCSVTYRGESVTFSATAITAMFLTKLKDITEAWCKGTVADVVIGVPSYFSDFQRAALLDAAKIAKLNVLRVMNEHTATALEYGYFRSGDFDPEKPTTVAFCQMGHSVFSVAIVQFVKGKLTVLCERSEKVGGRDMDECLIRCFAEEFKKKTSCDVLGNKKALFKLEDAVMKTKKVLSANAESNIACECLMEDHDFSSHINRVDFLEMCKPMMQKVQNVLQSAIAASGLPVSSIDSVEMCGGASRVPWVKEMCSKTFGGKELSTTMNADECVARGCALQAALLSPLYKVKEFRVEDTTRFSVSLGWQMPVVPEKAAQTCESVVFASNSLMNLLKVITFFRKDSFDVRAAYGEESDLPEGMPKELGTYTIELPSQKVPKKVKVKTAMTLHGTFVVQGAQLLEEEAEDGAAGSEADAKQVQDIPMPDAGKEKEGGSSASKKRPDPGSEQSGRKRRFRRIDLEVKTVGCPGMDAAQLEKWTAEEERMISDMVEVVETNARKNDLEAYILSMRSGISEGAKYGSFIKEQDRAKFSEQLQHAEDWLYDHLLDDSKQVFVDKLAELKVLGAPIESRYQDAVRRPERAGRLEKAIQQLRAIALMPGQKYQSVEISKLKSLLSACDGAAKWLEVELGKQEKHAKSLDPVLSCVSIDNMYEDLQKMSEAVLGTRIEAEAAEEEGA